jgi:hypothetical protein
MPKFKSVEELPMTEKNRQNKAVLMAAGIAFGLGGLIFVCWASSGILHGMRSKSWPKTDAIITRSKYINVVDHIDVQVEYRYVLDGKEYVGRKIAASNILFTGDFKSLAARYQVGTKAELFYNPSDASDVALQTGVNVGCFGTLLIGFIFVFIGLAVGYAIYTNDFGPPR